MNRYFIVTILFLMCGLLHAQNGEVKMWKGELTIPTYRVDAPEKAPFFERDFAYQRATRGVYPYVMNDNPTYDKVDSSHVALFLENDYIELCVLPGIGGRLFYAIDKTNGYDIFYHQHVIKPANVGMLGAWISGGVEWNVFHHHRATSQFPIDYRLVDNGDGSKTIWVGEIEERHRMSWAIGMTLYPDKSYIEISGKLMNSTFDRNSILYWSNVATHANKDYQIIFPETTDFGTFHHKNSFCRWPVTDSTYNHIEAFSKGIEASWWANQPASNSIFVYDLQDDFIGGYDHGKNAGTMLVGNHNINKGGKFWLWGPKAYGHAWECISLTDSDGPYVELMTAAYSDNQPDYCWLNPYEVKEFSSYWYGIRDLENVNRGNKYATVNMDILDKGKVHLAANVTEIRKGVKVTLAGPGGILFEKIVDMAPDKPFSADVKVEESALSQPWDVTMTLTSAEGEELISYHPYKKEKKPFPEEVRPPRKPSEIQNQEELYFTGMRNLQFHNAHVNPTDYFLEALRRDPGDTRCNTQMGIWYRKRGDYDKAASYLRTAIKRQTAWHTRPADAESMYNMGLVLKALGRIEAATDTLYRAVWDYEYASPAYFQLAQLHLAEGDLNMATQEVDMAVKYNGMNIEAKNLQTTMLRHAGQTDKAIALAEDVLSLDPIDYYATYELLQMGKGDESAFKALLRDRPESYIELAVSYLANSAYSESWDILSRVDAITPYPTVKYYLGYLADRKGDKDAAAKYFKEAVNLSYDYVFPFRLETLAVYDKSFEYEPDNAVTWYYIGNLLFEKQPDRAMEAWEKAVAAQPDFAMALRNLGWGWRFHRDDYPKAIAFMEKAVAADKSMSGQFLTELDEMYEYVNAPLEKRYEMLVSHHDKCLTRYESCTREIRMQTVFGDYDAAMETLMNHFFCRREHIEDLHDIYVDVCLLAGLKELKADNAGKAVEWFLKADEYPELHFYARLEYYARNSQVYYLAGLAYEKAGKKSLARKYWKMAVENETRDSDYNFEKALAMVKLDRKAEVEPIYEALVKTGESKVTEYVERFFESYDRGEYPRDVNSRAYYTQGLGYLGLGNKAKADDMFGKALLERNDNLWANYYLGNLKQ